MRLKSLYRCQQCGFTTPKWAGQCPDCEAWNTLTEEVVQVGSASPEKAGGRLLTEFSSKVIALSKIVEQDSVRLPTQISELDRLLGGGLVPGQVVLLAGPPGIGKSTLMLQAAATLAGDSGAQTSLPSPSSRKLSASGSRTRKVLYVSGEESLGQVSGRAKRLGIQSDSIYLVSETNLGKILDTLREIAPEILILDSIQTVYHPDLTGSPGSVGQVRECAAELLRAAKSKEIVTFLLGHITKEGSLAGPKILEHIVDTVLYFDTERHHLLRILRTQKNRFGPASEIGLFEMGEKGLMEVPDASAFFVSDRDEKPSAGRAVSVALEGSRPLLVEVQALVTPTRYPLPRRMATGLDLGRTQLLIAALEKHLRLHLENHDIFLSLSGGMKQKDPTLDLAACMAIISSSRDIPLPVDAVFLGEVGLLGQIGRITFLSQRLKEAARLGFKKAFVPARSLKEVGSEGLAVEGADSVFTLTSKLFSSHKETL